MNFFEEQEKARSRSGWLVFLFSVASLSLVVMTIFTAGVLLLLNGQDPFDFERYFQIYVWIGLVTIIFIGGLSLFKVIALSLRGGISLALDLGGEALDVRSSSEDERRLLNIVEEMSIASGVPKPEVFVFPDSSINAFAAGYSFQDAVIGVTRGALEQLNRDELQGVVAHEFSHILYGDMKINMRLMGVLYGIMAMATLGRALASTRSRRSRSGGQIAIVGVLIWSIGSLGNFFGRCIQSAISRQREYLADAAAVQFTRNPEGLAGALKKIMGNSMIQSPWSHQMNHFFIASPLGSESKSFFASHPPLEDRIRRIMKLPSSAQVDPILPTPQKKKSLSQLAGTLDHAPLVQAQELLAALSPATLASTREIYSVRGIIYALFFSSNAQAQHAQIRLLESRNQSTLAATAKRVLVELGESRDVHRLPLLKLSIPALRKMSPPQIKQFLLILEELQNLDLKIDLHEFCILSIVRKHLDEAPALKTPPTTPEVIQAFSHILCLAIKINEADTLKWQPILDQVAKDQKIRSGRLFVTPSNLDPYQSLDDLSRCPPRLKRAFLDALCATVMRDQSLQATEAALLRAVSLSLGVPLPLRLDPHYTFENASLSKS